MITKTVKKQELLEALDRVKGTVAASDMIPLLQCFCFKNGLIYGYNGSAGSATGSPIEDLNFCVKADIFYRIINSLFDDIEITLREDKRIVINSGSNATALNTLSTHGYPDIIPDQLEHVCAATNFQEALKKASITVGTNALKQELLGVTVAESYIYSSDGTRITRVLLDKAATKHVRLPGQAVAHLLKYGNPEYLFLAKGLAGAMFPDTKTVYITRLLYEPFPIEQVDAMMDVPKDANFIATFPDEVINIVRRIKMLAPSEDTDIRVENKDQNLIFTSRNEHLGDSREAIEWDYKRPFKFAVSPKFLEDALLITRVVDLSDVITGTSRSLRFLTEGFDHLCALMVLKG